MHIINNNNPRVDAVVGSAQQDSRRFGPLVSRRRIAEHKVAGLRVNEHRRIERLIGVAPELQEVAVHSAANGHIQKVPGTINAIGMDQIVAAPLELGGVYVAAKMDKNKTYYI